MFFRLPRAPLHEALSDTARSVEREREKGARHGFPGFFDLARNRKPHAAPRTSFVTNINRPLEESSIMKTRSVWPGWRGHESYKHSAAAR